MNIKFTDMLEHPTKIIAHGFGAGFMKPGPGTFGTLVGWLWFSFLFSLLGSTGWMVVILLSFPLGVWVCHVADQSMDAHDDSSIVFDEIWAIWLVMLFVFPRPFMDQVIAFLLFRLFDIWKPFPIGLIDRQVKGGLGIMLDDLIAAVLALFVFSVYFQISQVVVGMMRAAS